MQKLITFLLVLFSFNASAQYYWQESFEAPNDNYRANFVIDSLNPNNMWQIGKPQKTIFDSAYSKDNAIVTDTINNYAAHDTSVFTMLHQYSFGNSTFMLRFFYKLDKDAGALAKMEISGDKGLNWINPITEDSTYMFYWGGTKPRLDTQVHAWTKFELYMDDWAHAYPGGPYVFPHYRTADTILFRFTFASGDVVVPHDGWIMDNFTIEDYITEGYVAEVRTDDMVSIYPNPCKGKLYLYSKNAYGEECVAVIYNMDGREVYRFNCTSNNEHADLPLANGVYILKYDTGSRYAIKRLVINR